MIEIMKDRGWVEGTHYRIEPDGVDIRNPQSPIQIQVSHQDGWRILQHETGQHRVRMPKSGGSGLATNPVTVRVLPDTTVMAQFDESLIKTSASSAGGAGGQGRDHNNHKITLTYEDPVSGRKLVASSEEKTDRNTNYNNALRRLREQVTEAQAQANSILDPSTQIEANATGRIIRTLELGNARTDADRDLVRIVENNFSLRDDGNSTEFNPPDWRAYRMSPDALRIRDESRLDNLLSQNPPPEMPPAHLQQQWRNSTR